MAGHWAQGDDETTSGWSSAHSQRGVVNHISGQCMKQDPEGRWIKLTGTAPTNWLWNRGSSADNMAQHMRPQRGGLAPRADPQRLTTRVGGRRQWRACVFSVCVGRAGAGGWAGGRAGFAPVQKSRMSGMPKRIIASRSSPSPNAQPLHRHEQGSLGDDCMRLGLRLGLRLWLRVYMSACLCCRGGLQVSIFSLWVSL